MPKKSITNSIEYFLIITLTYIIMYIIIAFAIALPLKYIFLDYFYRIGWPTDFSLITVAMFLLAAKIVVRFILWAPRADIQRTSQR